MVMQPGLGVALQFTILLNSKKEKLAELKARVDTLEAGGWVDGWVSLTSACMLG
jgi:hypothetical protein